MPRYPFKVNMKASNPSDVFSSKLDIQQDKQKCRFDFMLWELVGL